MSAVIQVDANGNIVTDGAGHILGYTSLVALWPDPLPDGQVEVFYSYTLTASGGVPPYTFAVSSGTLPDGLSLDGSTGVVSGTPTSSVSMDAVTFSVTDSA